MVEPYGGMFHGALSSTTPWLRPADDTKSLHLSPYTATPPCGLNPVFCVPPEKPL